MVNLLGCGGGSESGPLCKTNVVRAKKCILVELMLWCMMMKPDFIVAGFLRLNVKQEILEIVCGETRPYPALRFAADSFIKNAETALL